MADNKSRATLSRRQFLARAAAAAATTLTVVNPRSVRGAPANSRLELGIIGCGGRGKWIGKLFEQNSNTKVVALADYFEDRLAAAREVLNVPAGRCYAGLKGYLKLLESKVDAVAIESPPYFHPEQAQAAVDAGKHVYLAKPVAVDVPGCRIILESAKKARGKLSFLVDFQTRNNEFFREAARRVHQGAIGKPVFGQVYYVTGRLRKKAEPGTPEARLRNWVFYIDLSGDIIVEQNIHVIDVATWLLDAAPLRACGTGGRKARTDVGDCWDHFVVTYWFPNDVIVDFCSGQFIKGYHDMCVRIYGSEGTVDTHYGGEVRIEGPNPWKGGRTDRIYTEGAVNNIKDFWASINSGKFLNNAEESVRSNLASILGRIAAYRGRVVTWEEMLNENEKLEADLSGLKA